MELKRKDLDYCVVGSMVRRCFLSRMWIRRCTGITMAFCILSLVLVSACMATASGKETAIDSDALQARAENFWKARVAGDLVACYPYEEDAKLKKVSLTDYVQSKGNLIYKSFKILGITKKGPEKAIVKVEIGYVLPAFGTSHVLKAVSNEEWVKIDGDWYHHVGKNLQEKLQSNAEKI